MTLMVLGMACFASADALIKMASQSLPSGVVLTVMALGGSTLFLAICLYQGTRVVSPLFFHPIVMLRNLAEVGAAICLFLAFAWSPLSTVSAIMQALPLVLTLTAAVLLKERVGPRRWTAVLLGLVGVLIIIRPTPDTFELATLMALAGTVSLALRDLTSRLAPSEASTPLLSFYAFFALIPAGIVMALFEEEPSPWTWPLVTMHAGIILFAFTGYYLVTIAMRVGEVSAVSPLRYTRLPFAALLGFFIFSEIPDLWTTLGSVLVIGSGLYVMLREAQLKRRAAA